MKKLVLAASVLVLGTAAASAADLAPRYYKAPPPMVAAMYDWSGFYAGINGGWGTSHNCWTRTATLGVAVPRAAEGCHDSSGGTVGGQLGYRWQAGPWVFGLEAQGNWADFSGSNVSLLFGGLATNRTRIDAFGLFTGQVGYAWNNVLGYVKGGAAVTDNRYEGLATLTGTVTDRASDTRWGATCRRRHRIRLRAELVGRARIRPFVHGYPQLRHDQRVPGRGLQHPQRRRQAGRRPRHCARQLSLRRPGRRALLIPPIPNNGKPRLMRGFLFWAITSP